MIAPVDLGQALANPGIYMEWPAGLPAPAPAPRARRVRRPGRILRKVAALAAVAVTAALTVIGGTTSAHAAQRPVWDGVGTYASGVQPLCPASLAGHTARAGAPGHRFTVTCVADGPVYVWDARRPVEASSPVAHASETVSAVFPVCVADVQAYALRGPASADYSAASTVHRGKVRAGHAVRVEFRFTRADAGRWGDLEVTGFECGRPETLPDGSINWAAMVTVTSRATFNVVTK